MDPYAPDPCTDCDRRFPRHALTGWRTPEGGNEPVCRECAERRDVCVSIAARALAVAYFADVPVAEPEPPVTCRDCEREGAVTAGSAALQRVLIRKGLLSIVRCPDCHRKAFPAFATTPPKGKA